MNDKRPEIKQKAQQAKQYVVKRLREGKKIDLIDMRRDRYFRICARVAIDGSGFEEELVKAGLGKEYDVEKKRDGKN